MSTVGWNGMSVGLTGTDWRLALAAESAAATFNNNNSTLMATRSAARRRRSLQEAPFAESPPACPVTTHKRRQKENVDSDLVHAGNFVRFPRHEEDGYSTGERSVQAEVKAKTKRTQKKKEVLKENTKLSTLINLTDNDEKDVLEFTRTVGRNTRSRKNVSVDIANGIGNENEQHFIEKVEKKSNKRKVTNSQYLDETDSHLRKKPKDSDEPFTESQSDVGYKKKSKRKLKNNKTTVPEITIHLAPETTDSLDKLQSPGGLQTSFNSINTTVESFHSAAGSPGLCEVTLVPEYHEKSDYETIKLNKSIDKNEKSIDSTFDKNDRTVNTTYDKNDKSVDTTFDRNDKRVNTNFDKNDEAVITNFDKNDKPVDTTFDKNDKAMNTTFDENNKTVNTTFDKNDKTLNTTFDKNDKTLNTTYEKHDETNHTYEKKSVDLAVTPYDCSEKKTKKSTPKIKLATKSISEQKSSTPNERKSLQKSISTDTLVVKPSVHSDTDMNTPIDKARGQQSSCYSNQNDKGKLSEDLFNTFIEHSDSSLESSLTSVGRMQSVVDSVTFQNYSHDTYNGNNGGTASKKRKSNGRFEHSDCTNENSTFTADNTKDTLKADSPKKLIREGTFTKESPEREPEALPSSEGSTESIKTPTKVKKSIPSAGSTPYHSIGQNTRSSEKSLSSLNLTRSVEKDKLISRRSSLVVPSRQTRVMFCSPVFTPAQPTDRKRIIKSNLKGSNKSFVFEDTSPPRPAARKRSHTHDAADSAGAKRTRLARDGLGQAAGGPSRPGHTGSAAKPTADSTPSKCRPLTPHTSRSDTKPASVRSKLPDFAALHKKQFDKMESLGDCKERRARRARQMLFPASGAFTVEGRKSPKVAVTKIPEKAPSVQESKLIEKKFTMTTEPTAKLNKSYTRFGFKLQTDVNPFSIPSAKTTQHKPMKGKMNATVSHFTLGKSAKSAPTKPKGAAATTEASKLYGIIPSLKRERSKQLLIRDKSSTIIADKKRENRDIIKGVRTNRRFELQMKSRQCI